MYTAKYYCPTTHRRIHDRQTLWNAVETSEKRKDAQPARGLSDQLETGCATIFSK
ncbi:MAG: MobA/MobL family protein [Nitrososphaerota archaeon]|nr:MobA/MobL family protein [Nitrososphaerota archaeon]